MKISFLTTSLLFASISQADIINCSFTEPFINTTYSTSRSELTYEGADIKKITIKNVSLQIKSAGVFELVSNDGQVLQTLNLNYQGSNGMNEAVYPYDAKDNTYNIIGGCESNYLKAKECL